MDSEQDIQEVELQQSQQQQQQQFVVYIIPNVNMRQSSQVVMNVGEDIQPVPLENQALENQVLENQVLENQVLENQVLENQVLEDQPLENMDISDDQTQGTNSETGSAIDLSVREGAEVVLALLAAELRAEQNEVLQNEQNESDEEQVEALDLSTHQDYVSDAQKMYASHDDSFDNDQKCSICLDSWSNYGEHRLCSLRCGHLFGLSCVQNWLDRLRTSERRCPECNTKAARKDIRILYAKKLVAVDTTDLEKIKAELNSAKEKIRQYEISLSRCKMKEQVYEKELRYLRRQVTELESNKQQFHSAQTTEKQNYLKKIWSFNVCQKSGCRVMAYNSWHRVLVATLKSTSQNLSDYGIRKIMLDTCAVSPYCYVHGGAIRDITFSNNDPNVCLSVGFDKSAVLTDVRSLVQIHKYDTGVQLWSCCWAKDNNNFFFTGAQNGSILKFDWRYLQNTIKTLETEDRTPVVSLAPVSSFSNVNLGTGGFLACHLNSCYAYMEGAGVLSSSRLSLDGPFISVRYDEKNSLALISCRANARQQCVRHNVCTIATTSNNEANCNVIHTLNGGSSQKLLSRPCHVYLNDDTLIAASNESSNSVLLWSASTGKQNYVIPVTEPIIDTCSFRINNTFLALLTQQKVYVYRHGDIDENAPVLSSCDL